MGQMIVIRHGESYGNVQESLFNDDAMNFLTPSGQAEVIGCGSLLRARGIVPQIIFTSEMTRARQTVRLLLDVMQIDVPVIFLADLNEAVFDISGNRTEGEERLVGRVLRAQQEHIADWMGEQSTVMLVGHSYWLRAFLNYYGGAVKDGDDRLTVGHAVPYTLTIENGGYRREFGLIR